MTVAEWVILRELYERKGTVSPSMIAESTGLTRGAVSKLIERLVSKNLMSRTDSNSDRRYQEIGLTMTAKNLIPKLAKLADQNDEQFFSQLTASEKKNLLETLKKLAELNKLNQLPIE